jgi:hypothetical protein
MILLVLIVLIIAGPVICIRIKNSSEEKNNKILKIMFCRSSKTKAKKWNNKLEEKTYIQNL